MSDIRGFLAANLQCWHRLTGTESDELVAIFEVKAAKIEALTQELADAKLIAHYESDVAAQAIADVNALQSEVEAQRKDAELMPLLKEARYELHACQAVIHLAGGFDTAYVRGAQTVLKAIDAAIAKEQA